MGQVLDLPGVFLDSGGQCATGAVRRISSVSRLDAEAGRLGDVVARHYSQERMIVAHGHGSLPSGPPVRLSNEQALLSYTEPGSPITAGETRKILMALDQGNLLESVPNNDRVHLRVNSDATPNYTISFGDRNGYETQSNYPLGFYLYSPQTVGEKLCYLGKQLGSRTCVHEVFALAANKNVDNVLFFGCKDGATLSTVQTAVSELGGERSSSPARGRSVVLRVGDDVKACADLNDSEGNTVYKCGDSGKATEFSSVDGEERFWIDIHRTGKGTWVKKASYGTQFVVTKQAINHVGVGDEIITCTDRHDSEGSIFKLRDVGKVTEIASSSGDDRFWIQIPRTGRGAWVWKASYESQFVVSRKASIPVQVGDDIRTCTDLNDSKGSVYKRGDAGKVTALSSRDGEDNFWIQVPRTGQGTWVKKASYELKFFVTRKASNPVNVGDDIKTCIDCADLEGSIHKCGDAGKVTELASVDGEESFWIQIYRTGLGTWVNEASWASHFFVSKKAVNPAEVGDEIRVRADLSDSKGSSVYKRGDAGTIIELIAVDGEQRFWIRVHSTGRKAWVKKATYASQFVVTKKSANPVEVDDDIQACIDLNTTLGNVLTAPKINILLSPRPVCIVGDAGKITELSSVDGDERFWMQIHRTGRGAWVKKASYASEFVVTKKASNPVEVGDYVKTCMDLSDSWGSVFKYGDAGKITELSSVDGEERFWIRVSRTGRGAWVKKESYATQFVVTKKALHPVELGDEIRVRTDFTDSKGSVYVCGDVGKITEFTSVNGEERFWIQIPRTGRRAWVKKASYASQVVVTKKASNQVENVACASASWTCLSSVFRKLIG